MNVYVSLQHHCGRLGSSFLVVFAAPAFLFITVDYLQKTFMFSRYVYSHCTRD